MSTVELTGKVRGLKELKEMAEELQAEITSIENTIKVEMTARNIDEMQADVFKVRWTKVISNRFDTKFFKTSHADLYNQYSKPTVAKRFSVA